MDDPFAELDAQLNNINDEKEILEKITKLRQAAQWIRHSVAKKDSTKANQYKTLSTQLVQDIRATVGARQVRLLRLRCPRAAHATPPPSPSRFSSLPLALTSSLIARTQDNSAEVEANLQAAFRELKVALEELKQFSQEAPAATGSGAQGNGTAGAQARAPMSLQVNRMRGAESQNVRCPLALHARVRLAHD